MMLGEESISIFHWPSGTKHLSCLYISSSLPWRLVPILTYQFRTPNFLSLHNFIKPTPRVRNNKEWGILWYKGTADVSSFFWWIFPKLISLFYIIRSNLLSHEHFRQKGNTTLNLLKRSCNLGNFIQIITRL